MSIMTVFGRVADKVSKATGHPATFVACCAIIVIWAVSGPIFGFSDTWQLIINTGTTIITFLMVFLIQNTQNRDSAALQTKLDELIRASAAQNQFIGIEHLSEEEVEDFRRKCEDRARERAGQGDEERDDGDDPPHVSDAVERAKQKAKLAAKRATHLVE